MPEYPKHTMMTRCNDCGADYGPYVLHICPNATLAARVGALVAALGEHNDPRAARAVRELQRAVDGLAAARDALERVELEGENASIYEVRDDIDRARTNAHDALEAMQRSRSWPSR